MRGRRSQPGDTRWSPNGYHYTRTEDKWELTHKIIAEEKLGRPLADGERVRFEDGDRTNLSADNIIVYMTKPKTAAQRLAALKAKRDELDEEIRTLEAELGA